MTISVAGKRIIITGGGRGIGAATVRYFVAEGASVSSFDVLEELGHAVADEATGLGPGRATFQRVDVADEGQVKAAVEAAVKQMGGLDAVINIAGIAPQVDPENMDEAVWDRLLGINVKGVAHLCQAAFPHMKDGGGSIVNFGSDVGLMHTPVASTAYGATKGAIISYTRLIASAWGKHAIRANVVNPLIRTPMYDEFVTSLDPAQLAAYQEQLRATVPLGGTLGDAALDLAPVLEFLVSDAARFVTAQIIGVNGGFNPGR
jgi:NAD(P)-dependent dehydrogenase (short-subunit alcohol dehydrogenase family)